jgi:hypothetical protein
MPYTTIPTKADGELLSAAHLNLIAANQGFLYGLGNTANIPFNGVRATVEDFDSSNGTWFIRHRLRYLHWRFLAESGNSPTVQRVFFAGYRVYEANDTAFVFGSAIDLEDPSTWAGWDGAWLIATDYSATTNGGDVVSNGGSYYHCISNNTSSADTEPGVGVDWEIEWELIALVVETIYETYIEASFNDPGNQMTVEYIYEADAA